MFKLLNANFSRLFKNKLFWVCVIAVFVLSVLSILTDIPSIETQFEEFGERYTLEQAQLGMSSILGGVFALLCSMFFGTEYTDGMVRNKFLAGNSRLSIYFGNFLTACAADIIITVFFMLAGFVGVKWFGWWSLSPSELLGYAAVLIMNTVCYTAVYTMLFMLIDNRAVCVVVSSLVYVAMAVAASIIFQCFEVLPNSLQSISTAVMLILPPGQIILIASLLVDSALKFCAYSLAVSAVLVFAGFKLFRNKDIN